MEHNPLFDRLWGLDGRHPFGNPYEMEDRWNEERKGVEKLLEEQELETEYCEFLKGDFKTTIVCKFNKQGYMVSHTAFVENLAENTAIMQNLREELFTALDEERYGDVPELQRKINDLRFLMERKPTL